MGMILCLYPESVLDGAKVLRYRCRRGGAIIKPEALRRSIDVRVTVGADKDPFPRRDGKHLWVQGRERD